MLFNRRYYYYYYHHAYRFNKETFEWQIIIEEIVDH